MRKLISWVEIPAQNMEKTCGFYSKLLNIELEIMDWGEEAMACFPDGEGAISRSPGFKPCRDGVLVSFDAGESLEKSLKKVKQMGGEIIKPITKIEAEGRGYFALIRDPEGNQLGLYRDEK